MFLLHQIIMRKTILGIACVAAQERFGVGGVCRAHICGRASQQPKG